MKSPLISVAIANHNYGRFLIQAIDSVLCQTYKNFEILVYDDASTDDSVELVKKKYGDRVVLVEGSPNCGAGASRNHLIALSKGKYIMFLDSDDLLFPDALQNLVDATDGNDVVFGMVDSFTELDTEYKRHSYINDMVKKYQKDHNIYTLAQIMTPSNKLISKSFISKNNLKFTQHRVMNDCLFAYLLAFAKPKCGFTNATLVNIRHHGNSLSNVCNENKTIEVLKVTREVLEYSRERGFYDKIKLNGNNLVYFMINHASNEALFEQIVRNRWIIPFRHRVLIAVKLLGSTRNHKYLKLL